MLLIGGGVSAIDIAGDISAIADKLYKSSRGGPFDLPDIFLPKNTTRVASIDRFEVLANSDKDIIGSHLDPMPLRVFVDNGTVLTNIHRVVICTGYHMALPFLRQYHNDKIQAYEADEEVLVSDGTQIHNLHKDIFYIPDPTLAFIGIPFFTATFTLFEFQAIALAAVFANRASLPIKKNMRVEYNERVQRKGYGKGFHSLKEKDVEYVNELLDWVNEGLAKSGIAPVEGHSKEWHQAWADRTEQVKTRMQDGQRANDNGNGNSDDQAQNMRHLANLQ